MAKKIFQAVKGMADILPAEQPYWEKVKQVTKTLAESYGFSRLETPLLEEADLFIKGSGPFTDIVEKEMFGLRTRGGDKLVLRPEFTPSVVRSYLENGLSAWPQPVKLYSWGPVFRYSKPQRGRYRQFHQVNFEVIGSSEPALDAQSIHLAFLLLTDLGLKDLVIQINSIGCPGCRPAYRKKLVAFYRKHKKEICLDCQRRLSQNPLRLLDCKKEKCVQISQEAPQLIDDLCSDCRSHFRSVLEFLDELAVPYILNAYLVRGLDYYTKTVFEVWPGETEEARQNSLGGGGRYDGLVKLLGGPETPAIGFALGLERIIQLIKERKIKVSAKAKATVFLIQLGSAAKRKSLKLFEELRRAGLAVDADLSKKTIRSQLRLADKKEASFALILGQKEVLDQTVIIRDMSSGVQETIPQSKLILELKKRLKRS